MKKFIKTSQEFRFIFQTLSPDAGLPIETAHAPEVEKVNDSAVLEANLGYFDLAQSAIDFIAPGLDSEDPGQQQAARDGLLQLAALDGLRPLLKEKIHLPDGGENVQTTLSAKQIQVNLEQIQGILGEHVS